MVALTVSPAVQSSSWSFTGADADERNRDVRLGLLAGEADHVAGEVEDLDRLAHVEHVHLTAAADRPACTTRDTASGIVMK